MITWKLCEKCYGQQRINKGWILPRFVECDECDGRGEVSEWKPEPKSTAFISEIVAAQAAAASPQSTPTRKGSEMFDNLQELVDAVENGLDNSWHEADVVFVTPDGKRWGVSKFMGICGANEDDYLLECRLKEMPSSSPPTPAKAPDTIAQLVAQTHAVIS